jgi:hypothetical protein
MSHAASPNALQPNPTRRLWKIAPGGEARFWIQCRDTARIAIGWLPDSDYRNFRSKSQLQKALKKAYPEHPGGASSILRFSERLGVQISAQPIKFTPRRS